MRGAPAAALAAVLLTVAGCTTVPNSSAPQIVKPVAVDPGISTPSGPPLGAEPRSILEDFLQANGEGDATHASARLYLAPRTSWSDATVTVIDRPQVGNLVKLKRLPSGMQAGKITVTGRTVGAIDENGVYKPFLRGDGSGLGGVHFSQTYGLVQVRDQWRIDTLPPGLVVSSSQFDAFRQYAVYYLDGAGDDLAPVARFSQLTALSDIIKWLVTELAQQPPASLSTGLPPNGPARQITTTVPPDPTDPNSPVVIEIPGASALDRGDINRLAAQIGATLQVLLQVDRIEITDGGTPVRIPAVGETVFPVESMSGRFRPSSPGSNLFYVRDGGVYEESGRPIPGRVGAGAYGLTSAALTVPRGSRAIQVAGVRGSGSGAVLDVPNPHEPGALVDTTVHGQLSRPAWAPDRKEVWIGDGTQLERVTGPRSVQTVPLDVATGKASGVVGAVRISPDGTRVALVLRTADSSQIYVGTIVRNATQVSVTNLAPISPQAVRVSDVAWNDELKLFAVGSDTRTGDSQVYEVQCDGSLWNPRDSNELPGAPDTVTAFANSEVVVSIGDTVWQQNGTSWQGLLDGETRGTNPIYLE